MGVVAHEISHAQWQAITAMNGFKVLGWSDKVQSSGPVWLREGVAYLHSDLALDQGASSHTMPFALERSPTRETFLR